MTRCSTVVLSATVLLAASSHAQPTAAPFDLPAGNGADFVRFGTDDFGGGDAISILPLPIDGSTFEIGDASIAGATDAYDGVFELGVLINGVDGFTLADDDGVLNLIATAEGTRVVLDATASPVPPSGFSIAAEHFVFANEPLARLLFSITNESGQEAMIQVEMGSDSGTGGTPFDAATASGDMVVDASDTWIIRTDTSGISKIPDPIQIHSYFGEGAPVTPTIVRIDPADDDDSQVLFDLLVQDGETQSLIFYIGVADPVAPTGLTEAIALADRLDASGDQLRLDGLLAGIGPATANTVVNYLIDEPCPADTNGDGVVSPADFSAWIDAFNNQLPACDQNGDGQCDPTDFTAWVANFNNGC
ncbi:MAG: hypothetical protein ED559_10760 [Phycisphaera sp.]|nr:MAG: hypothetical protein ED559_10760 [Phycisphaera sp.]